MLRSLYSGISGLKNHQVGIDVIGNNLANVNTTGYKASRVSFADLVSQSVRSASGPNPDAGLGGINPAQVGLGMTVASIDNIMTQGNRQTTNNFTDLALQGEGFFVVSNGASNYYTRAGLFAFDYDGNFVSTTNGMKVQGYNAEGGVMGSTIEDIVVPKGTILPAKETTSMSMVGNLDSASEQVGTILTSGITLATDDGTSDVNGLYAGFDGASGNLNDFVTGMTSGQTTITIEDVTAGETFTYTYKTGVLAAGEFNALSNGTNGLVERINADFTNLNLVYQADGSIRFTNGGGAATTVNINSSNTLFQTAFSSCTGSYAAGATNDSDQFSHRASESDLLTTLKNSDGNSLGIVATDVISISGNVGGSAAPTTATLTVGAASTYANLADLVTATFGITNADNAEITSEGALKLTGDGGTAYAISDFSMTAASAASVPRSTWNNVFEGVGTNWSKAQSAQDNRRAEISVYDENGTAHTLTLAMNIRSTSGGLIQWVFDASSVDSESGTADAVSPTSGTITFNSNGSLSAFSPSSLTITPAGVADPFTVQIDPGETGTVTGLVSFEGSSSAKIKDQDGYAAGVLDKIAIDQSGLMTGTFTNGKNLDLAKILVSKFENPAGLERSGDNLWTETRNSGLADVGGAGENGRAVMLSNQLEMSNVDLSSEFTNMIVMQRGFQANASTIRTSDEQLQELVRLKR